MWTDARLGIPGDPGISGGYGLPVDLAVNVPTAAARPACLAERLSAVASTIARCRRAEEAPGAALADVMKGGR